MAFVYSEDSAFTGRSTPTTVLILCLNDVGPLDICMKKCYREKIIFDKMTAKRTYRQFSYFFLYVRAFTGQSTPTTVFDGTICYHAYMMHEEMLLRKNNF